MKKSLKNKIKLHIKAFISELQITFLTVKNLYFAESFHLQNTYLYGK